MSKLTSTMVFFKKRLGNNIVSDDVIPMY